MSFGKSFPATSKNEKAKKKRKKNSLTLLWNTTMSPFSSCASTSVLSGPIRSTITVGSNLISSKTSTTQSRGSPSATPTTGASAAASAAPVVAARGTTAWPE